ncbi:PREDICTED: glutathione S-transferase T3-like isoform X5 [Camelina sativa]|uniref:Glutathione S-transferase T3-like isoform X5 n=1 Tax=Camelina sativa TaxID=90675 RepID=A0ABM0SZ66_CAMSA|nr:PREDICTED: glutathione S-transferase T3-like isoform X5 [Camelina sativa]
MNISFSTQYSDAPTPSKDRRPSRKKWSPTEDVVLITAWLNTTKDPKFEAFWTRIATYCASSPKLSGFPKREANCCKHRWKKINDAVSKFVRCYDEAATTRTQKSSTGQSENDVMKLANQIYLDGHKVKFTLEHAWRELRHDPKWCASSSFTKKTGMTKRRRKCEEGSAQSSTSHLVVLSDGEDDEAMPPPPPPPPPPRVQASSQAIPQRKTSTVEGEDKSEFQRMWEIKQKDYALQEKLSKHRLLDTLLSKTEPLSEMEMALKNKLINDMLSS